MNVPNKPGRRWTFLLTPKWIAFHLIVIVGIVTMVNLGFWQLRRLDERREFNATVSQRIGRPPVSIESLLPNESVTSDSTAIDKSLDNLEWRAVVVEGTFEQDADIEIVNKSLGGRPGSHVISPLRLTDGRLVLINRGFIPLNSTASPPPSGEVTIIGVLRRSQQRGGLGLRDPESGPLTSAHRVDIVRLAPQLDAPVVPMYVEITERWPNDSLTNGPAPLQLPELGEGNHLSYAGQWFIFSAAVAIGWVLAVRRSWYKRYDNAGR